jgi:hypothetical protein
LAATFFKNRKTSFSCLKLTSFPLDDPVLNNPPDPSSSLFFLAIERCFRHLKILARYTGALRFPDPQFSLFRMKLTALSIRSPTDGSISIPTQLVRFFYKLLSACQKKLSFLSSGSFSQ